MSTYETLQGICNEVLSISFPIQCVMQVLAGRSVVRIVLLKLKVRLTAVLSHQPPVSSQGS